MQRQNPQFRVYLWVVGESEKQALVEFEGCVNLTALDVGLGAIEDLREAQLNLIVSPVLAVGNAA